MRRGRRGRASEREREWERDETRQTLTPLFAAPPRIATHRTTSQGLLLGDIFSTGVFCAVNAGLASPPDAGGAAPAPAPILAKLLAREAGAGPGAEHGPPLVPATPSTDATSAAAAALLAAREPVFVVVGCGPVGLCAVHAALELLRLRAGVARGDASPRAGLGRVFAIDAVASRLAAAAAAGATPLNFVDGDVAAAVLAASAGLGADAVLECVGAPQSLALSLRLLRPGGGLSSVGVCSADALPWRPDACYDKNITFRVGRCSARSFMPLAARVLLRLKARGVDVAAQLVTHRVPLGEAVAMYARFAAREEGVGKVVLEC